MSRLRAILAVHLMLLKNEKILLSRRFHTGFADGNYSLVAGHVEKNETILQAMIREAKEEVMIDIDKSELRIVQVMYRKSGDEERIDYFIVCTTWNGDIVNNEPNKCDDLGWFNINQLPFNTVPYIRHAIRMYKESEYFSEFGWD